MKKREAKELTVCVDLKRQSDRPDSSVVREGRRSRRDGIGAAQFVVAHLARVLLGPAHISDALAWRT